MADLKTYDVLDFEPLRELILSEGTVRVLAKGECYVNLGEVCDTIGLVVDGVFGFCRPDYKGDNQICSLSMKGELVGSVICESGRRSYFDVMALCRSEVCVVPVSALDGFEDPYHGTGFRERLLYAVAYGFMIRAASYRCDSPEMRYRELLERNPDIVSRVSMTAIASYLGVTRETFARMRAKLKKM